jgi:hypothetical protein
MKGLLRRIRAAAGDRSTVRFCDACGSAQVCDTSGRGAVARDRATSGYLSLTGPR